jgi:2-C-methyl-D-erythritol 4-phosphate cytidylyltransferase/2-C-methyl-D-erythritol 2,4-cyclodiphosphate synthase
MRGEKSVAAIVVAAGSGDRAANGMASEPKQYRRLAGVPVLTRTIEALLALDAIDWVLPVIRGGHEARYAALGLDNPKLLDFVVGGADRQASVRAGLAALASRRPDEVLIQDAARPFVDGALVDGVLAALADHDGAVPVVPVTDTIKRSRDGRNLDGTEDRHTLFAAQTPQGFHFAAIHAAHLDAAALPQPFTDDAALAEWAGLKVGLAAGSSRNIKITLPEDFLRAERSITRDIAMEVRIGTGFDVHPFEAGSFVTLGGIRIEHPRRLQGHSDADVALHALTDALYGALGEGDIGTHFPPSDPQWRGADSALFLGHAAGLVTARHGRIVNLDLTIVCEAPRIGPHVAAMRERIGQICTIPAYRVAVKATTSERLGFTGREEGIVAMASASIEVPREE